MNLISMGSLSLGRTKWGGSTWAKGAQEGRAPWGSCQEASHSPLGATLGRGNPRAPPLGLSPPPRWLPSPSPINRGDGGTPSTHKFVLFAEGLPLLSFS